MKTARRSRRLALVGLAVSLTMVVTACGSGDDNDDATTGSTPSSSGSAIPAPTGTPLGISVMVPDTGAGNLKPLGDGVTAFAAYANAQLGGFGGRPGKIDRCDYANDPQKAADCARSAGDNTADQIAIGSGRFGDVLLDTVSKASTPMPYVCPAQTRPTEGTSPNSVCLYAGSPMGYYSAMTYFKSKGLTKGYFVTADSDAGKATGAILGGFAKTLGQTVQLGYFATSQSDFLPVAQAAISTKPDFILIGAGVPQELSFTQALVTLGNTLPVGTWSSLLPQSSLDQLKAAKFPIAFDALTPDAATSTDPEMVLYRDWMKKQGYPDTDIGDLSLQGWLAGRFIQAASDGLKKTNTEITRASMLTAIRTGSYKIPLLPKEVSLANAPKATAGFTSIGNASVKIAVFENGTKTITDQVATLP